MFITTQLQLQIVYKAYTGNFTDFIFQAVLRIWDVYPESEYFHPGSGVKKISDPDPH
jgi:hypothetical protein